MDFNCDGVDARVEVNLQGNVIPIGFGGTSNDIACCSFEINGACWHVASKKFLPVEVDHGTIVPSYLQESR